MTNATEQDPSALWPMLKELNHRRRAIRDFDGRPVPDEIVRELLTEAMLTPTSVNLQPYQFHWVKNRSEAAGVLEACNGQRAVATASTIIFIAASPKIARRTVSQQLAYIDASEELPERSKDYHRKQLNRIDRIFKFGAWPIWTPFLGITALFRPSLSLTPIGHLGSRGWAARNAILAAQTLMLAATARGIDSCAMEGFSHSKVAAVLGLPRGTVVPVVIALGYRANEARLEPQWRRTLGDALVEH